MITIVKKRKEKDEKPKYGKKTVTTADVIDIESLEARKREMTERASAKHKKENTEEAERKPKWFEKVMSEDDFTIVEVEQKYYGRHVEWKDTIHFGPYNTRKEVENIIGQYISNSKKETLKRKDIPNLHSIVFKEK